MLQIAIFGIAIMLLLKGLDVWHQQKIAESLGHSGSQGTAILACAFSVVGAAFLVWSSFEQVDAVPAIGSSVIDGTSGVDLQAAEEAAEEAEKAAEAAMEGL